MGAGEPTGSRAAATQAGVGLVWLAAIVQFVYVTVDAYSAYDARAWDFWWIYLGVERFVDGTDPYDVYLLVNPPATLVLFAPFAAVGFKVAHVVFLGISAAAIAAAGMVSLRAAGLPWRGLAGALVLLVLAYPSAVRSTLGLGNVNAVIVLCEAVALAAMLGGRWAIGGIALGLSFAVKPILIPLLLIPLVARRFGTVAIAIAIPVVLSALALAVNPGAVGFVTDRLSFLLNGNAEVLQAGNVSILGAVDNLDLPRALGEVLRVATLVAALGLAWLRWRGAEVQETEHARRLRILEATGFVMLATLLCFSFSWLYYGVYLLPLVVTVAHRDSLLRHPVAVVGLTLMIAPIGDTTQQFRPTGFEEVRPTVSWLLILIGMGLALRAAGRAGSPRDATA